MVVRVLIVVGLVVLAGCGVDDGGSAPASTAAPSSTGSGATTVAPAPTAAPPATAGPTIPPGLATGPPGGSAQRLDRPLGDGGPATQGELIQPGGLALGPNGSLYIADTFSNLVRRVRPDGVIESIAGLPEEGPSPDGAAALDSPILSPTDVAVASDGTVYVAESGRIRRIAPDGTITSVAGVEGEPTFGPVRSGVPAAGEPIGAVGSIALAPDGSLLFSEQEGRIRKVTPDGTLHLVAGVDEYDDAIGLGEDGPAEVASLADPWGLTVGPDGTIYVAENSRVRRITPDGIIDTIAGGDPQSCPPAAGATDRALDARVCIPVAVAVGPDGSVYVGDGGEVYRIGPDGSFDHIAGQPEGAGFGGDGGAAADATLQFVSDLVVAPDGTLFVLDSCNHRVRRVGADGVITTVAGSGPVCPEKEYGR